MLNCYPPIRPSQTSNFILYTAVNGNVSLSVVLRDETVWLTQQLIQDQQIIPVNVGDHDAVY